VPTATEHHTWANYNVGFYAHIGSSHSQWQPWAMTALFYAVVHDVQSLLSQYGKSPSTHRTRLDVLRQNPQWTGLAAHYDTLSQRSTEARYLCVTHSQAELALAEMAVRLAQQEVARLRPSPV
jgi:uncharacterized protein (UPF0332 family)